MANTDKDATYTLGRELCEIIISHLRGNKDERKSITEQSKEIREFFEKVTLEQKIDILSHSYGWTPSDSNILIKHLCLDTDLDTLRFILQDVPTDAKFAIFSDVDHGSTHHNVWGNIAGSYTKVEPERFRLTFEGLSSAQKLEGLTHRPSGLYASENAWELLNKQNPQLKEVALEGLNNIERLKLQKPQSLPNKSDVIKKKKADGTKLSIEFSGGYRIKNEGEDQYKDVPEKRVLTREEPDGTKYITEWLPTKRKETKTSKGETTEQGPEPEGKNHGPIHVKTTREEERRWTQVIAPTEDNPGKLRRF